MIYVIEIPHQRKPFCWTAVNKDDLLNKLLQEHCAADESPEDTSDLDAWIDFNGHDLSCQYIFWTDEEAREAYDSGYMRGHQHHEAESALFAQLPAEDEE